MPVFETSCSLIWSMPAFRTRCSVTFSSSRRGQCGGAPSLLGEGAEGAADCVLERPRTGEGGLGSAEGRPADSKARFSSEMRLAEGAALVGEVPGEAAGESDARWEPADSTPSGSLETSEAAPGSAEGAALLGEAPV